MHQVTLPAHTLSQQARPQQFWLASPRAWAVQWLQRVVQRLAAWWRCKRDRVNWRRDLAQGMDMSLKFMGASQATGRGERCGRQLDSWVLRWQQPQPATRCSETRQQEDISCCATPRMGTPGAAHSKSSAWGLDNIGVCWLLMEKEIAIVTLTRNTEDGVMGIILFNPLMSMERYWQC